MIDLEGQDKAFWSSLKVVWNEYQIFGSSKENVIDLLLCCFLDMVLMVAIHHMKTFWSDIVDIMAKDDLGNISLHLAIYPAINIAEYVNTIENFTLLCYALKTLCMDWGKL